MNRKVYVALAAFALCGLTGCPSQVSCGLYTVCEDNNGCTTDTCEEGVCVFDADCEDDHCLNDACVQCLAGGECDDSNACTTDSCSAGGDCANTPIPDCNGGGEAEVLEASLTGAQEVPPVTTTATGSGNFNLNAARTTLSFAVTATGLSGPLTAAHFHLGAVGVDGDIIQDITTSITEVVGGVSLTGEWAELAAAEVTAILNEEIYVNLHTALNPGGEIRGQVLPSDAGGS